MGTYRIQKRQPTFSSGSKRTPGWRYTHGLVSVSDAKVLRNKAKRRRLRIALWHRLPCLVRHAHV